MFENFRIKAEDVYKKSLNNEIERVYKAIKDRTIIGEYYILVEELSEVVKAMLIADGYPDGRRFDDKIKISWEKD